MSLDTGTGSEGDAAQHFGEPGLTHDGELLLRGDSCVRVREAIVDGNEAVGIGARVTAAADGRGDRPEGDSAVTIDAAFNVAQAIACWRPGKARHRVVASRIAGHGVGHAELQTVGQGVGELPGAAGCVEDPLLQTCSGLRGGMGVESGVIGEAIALSILMDQRGVYSETFSGFTITKFDGTTVTV